MTLRPAPAADTGAVAADGAGIVGRDGAWRPGRRLSGVLLAVVGVTVLSPDALIIRSIHEPPSTLLFWRGLLTAISVVVLVTIMSRGRLWTAFRAIGRAGLLVALFQAGSNTSFVTAVTQTSAANVLVLVATAPLFAALLSWVALGEPVPLRTWLAIGGVIAAVGYVVAGSISIGHLQGDLIALGGSVCSAAAMTVVRHARAVSMIPAMAVAAAIMCLVGLTFGVRVPDEASQRLFAIQGLVLLPGAIALITTAIRRLPAPEVSLINRLELVLGSMWVWLVLGEAPTTNAIVSGIAIATILVLHTWMGIRAETKPA